MGGNGKQFNQGQLKWKSREKKVGNRKFVKLRIRKKEYIGRKSVYIYIKKERGINKGKNLQAFLVIPNYFS